MSVIAKAFFGLALVLLVLSVAVDFLPVRVATDLDHYQPYAGREPWSIARVRPGERLETHMARLGTPERDIRMNGANRVIRWTSPRDITLTMDPRDEIIEVLADVIVAGDQTLVDTGMSRAEVERVLGRGKVRTSSRPSGSGVISLGWQEVSKTLSYDNQGVRFEITLEEDRVKYMRALKPPPPR